MAGDESNAMVDALDAVNLMTVHAAKGLEFPVVFVVNLSRGAGGRGGAVEVVTRVEADGTVEDLVSLDGLAEEVGDEIEAREREESKRLVYVALTRARDRLYLATTLARNGAFAPGPASLGNVLPASLAPAFAQAAAAGAGTEAIAWVAASGTRHELRVVTVAAAPAVAGGRPRRRLRAARASRTGASNVSDLARAAPATALERAIAPRPRARCLVHRAVARRARGRETPALARAACRGDRDQALDACPRERDDIRELITEADVLHEVPLSWTTGDGATVRAVLDAWWRTKTGDSPWWRSRLAARQEADARQLADCVAGLERLLPGKIVSGRIIRLNS